MSVCDEAKPPGGLLDMGKGKGKAPVFFEGWMAAHKAFETGREVIVR
jgi:hypothetical protein